MKVHGFTPVEFYEGGLNMAKYEYDLVVIGGGAAGLVTSKTANGFGKKVAIIEKKKLGGECTWNGCIPSKALIKSSQIAHQIKDFKKYGLKVEPNFKIDTGNVMAHVQTIVQKVYNENMPESLEKLGINIIFGDAQFVDNHSVTIGPRKITAKKFIICTGSSALIPPIEGLNTVSYLTNESLFHLKSLPESMIILGGGPIGIEISQALNRLNVNTTVVEMLDRILLREDVEMSDMLADRLKEEGVKILTQTKAVKFGKNKDKIVVNLKDQKNQDKKIESDTVLVAVGRKPNTDGLKLENAGIKYNSKGIITDDYLRTDAPNIYACGDVVGPYQFSHLAEYQAVIATINIFLPLKRKVDYSNVIWCTFTHPELAHLSLTEDEARKKYGNGIKVYRQQYKNLDRAKTDNEEIGLAKFICNKKGNLIGAHIIGNNASEALQEAQLLKSFDIKLSKIQSVIHSYPIYSEIVRKAGKNAYIENLRNNFFVKLGKRLFSKNK